MAAIIVVLIHDIVFTLISSIVTVTSITSLLLVALAFVSTTTTIISIIAVFIMVHNLATAFLVILSRTTDSRSSYDTSCDIKVW